jgi:hypothetical protein
MKSRKAPMRALVTGLLMSAAISAPALAAPTLEEVMAAPDDVALNLAFARAEADAGDLLSAAGALERVLLAQPNAHQARLFYAAVLYRLGDYQGSRQQLAQLDNVELTPLQRAEKERYKRSIEKRQSRFEVTGQLTAGVAWEEDAIGPLLNQFDFDFFPPLEEEATFQVYSGRVGFQYKLAPEGEYAIYGSASAYHKSDLSDLDIDFERAELRLGVQHVGRKKAWQAGVVGRRYWVIDEEHLTELGAQGWISKRLNMATTVHLAGEAVSQEFEGEPFFFAFLGGGRDGSRTDVNLGVTHRYSSRSTINGTIGYEWKEAQRKPFDYDAPYVRVGYERLLGRGAYLDLTGALRNVKYEEEDVLLFGERREEVRSRVRLAVGAPFSAFAPQGATGDIRENIKVEAAVSHDKRDTEFPLVDYESWGGELRFIWRFGR